MSRFWKAAVDHPARRMTEPDLHAIRAWLAERQRNRQAEQSELELLVRDHPGDTKAVGRLAALMLEAGQPHEAERLHRLKSQSDSAKDRIRKILLDESQMLSHAAELARLSLALNRDFDAAAWSVLDQIRAMSDNPARISFDGSMPLPEALAASARQLSAREEVADELRRPVRRPWPIASPTSGPIRLRLRYRNIPRPCRPLTIDRPARRPNR